MDYNRLEQLDTIPLSSDDFKSTIGVDANDVLKYSQLSQFKTIEELLPNNKDFKIIFLDWGSKIGHWTCIYKLKDKYEYYNSFGNKYDNDLNVLTKCKKMILGENVKEFTRLLGKNKCSHSAYRTQGKESNSCGRYVISRISFLQMGYNNDEYHDYLDSLREKYDIDYDLVVCLLVPIPREDINF